MKLHGLVYDDTVEIAFSSLDLLPLLGESFTPRDAALLVFHSVNISIPCEGKAKAEIEDRNRKCTGSCPDGVFVRVSFCVCMCAVVVVLLM